MKPKIKLVTRADDAGSCRSANEAILEAVEAGTIKNVSFMAVGPEIEHAVELLGGRDDICYGLHVTLNAEWEEVKWGPLLDFGKPALSNADGYFLPSPQEMKEQLERLATAPHAPFDSNYTQPEDVWSTIGFELNTQFDRLRELGLPISYVDEHMGASWIGFRHDIEWLCRANELIDHHPLSSLPNVEPSDDALADVRKQLIKASLNAYVWVTHPGKVAPDMNRFYLKRGEPGIVARERDAERRLLTDPRLREMWDKLKVKPCRYDEVLSPGRN